jgi:hypothetical protein
MFLTVDYLALAAIRHRSFRPTAEIFEKFLTHSPGKEKHNQSHRQTPGPGLATKAYYLIILRFPEMGPRFFG